MPKLIDIHCHLDFRQFDEDREDVIKRTLNENVEMIDVGTCWKTSKKAVELAEKHDGIWASVGLHPTDGIGEGFDLGKYRALAKHPKVVAIGECGLDYFRCGKSDSPQMQREVFKRQIELAVELDKPLIIHCRDAHDDALDIVSSFKFHVPRLQGNMHFFTGNWEQAQKYLEMGFSLSFDGPITFSRDYDEVIAKTPFDRIMVETDSPFAAPRPWRGQRNEPLFVKEVVKRIAEIKKVSFEEAAEQTTKNAIVFFKLKN